MQARADMDSIAERLEEQYPEGSANLKISVVPLREQYTGSAKPILRVLAGVVGILLLISCVNIAQLLLARATGRRKEIALRAALGAGRGRVLRQLLTESLVLGLAGAILGAALSTVAFTFLARLIPDNFPQGTTLALDPVVLLFAATVGVLTSVAFGLGPSLAASRFNLNDALKQSKMFGPGGRRRKIRSALVVVEVSMSAVLLVAATLLLRSYHQLSSVELGLSTEGLWIIETPLSTSRYRDSQRRSELASGVIERISALSGVVSAGYVNYAPLVFKGGRAGFLIEGRPMPAPNQFPQQIVSDRVVSPGYFSTIGVPVLSGRPFEERDGPASVPGVLINQTMARMFWGDENPLGQRIRLSGSNTARWLTIIGVVGDMRQMGLELVPQPEMYLSFNQLPAEVPPFFWPRYLAVRTEGVDPIKLAAQVRHAVASIDPNQPVSSIRSMRNVIDSELVNRNTQLILVGAFSVLALLLAGIGLYGVLAYDVAQRKPEIGLRMALGATGSRVLSSVLRRTLLLTSVGVLIGLAAAGSYTGAEGISL